MGDATDGELRATLDAVAHRARRYRERGLGEQDTKASLIEPMLKALGWDPQNPEEVQREFRAAPGDNPVDYAIVVDGAPRLLIEAKGLGQDLAERRRVGQVLGYAAVVGVAWCVLTDGDEYRFYNAAVALDADDKLLARVRLSEAEGDEALRCLSRISRSGLEEGLLGSAWTAAHAVRQVHGLLASMCAEADPDLIRLVRRRAPALDARAIAGVLPRLELRLVPDRGASAPKPSEGADATLVELIRLGILTAPLRLCATRRGGAAEAVLRPDGRVEFDGQVYSSCSGAAVAAIAALTGRSQTANGWTTWRYVDASGRRHTLDDARLRLRGAAEPVPNRSAPRRGARDRTSP